MRRRAGALSPITYRGVSTRAPTIARFITILDELSENSSKSRWSSSSNNKIFQLIITTVEDLVRGALAMREILMSFSPVAVTVYFVAFPSQFIFVVHWLQQVLR